MSPVEQTNISHLARRCSLGNPNLVRQKSSRERLTAELMPTGSECHVTGAAR
jgi:hypothetical protein